MVSTLNGLLSDQFEIALKEFSGKAPLFPVPSVVFFPKTFQTLHVFEESYRAMLADIERYNRMVCMVLLKPGQEDKHESYPPIHKVGTLGYIDFKKTNPDGTFNILLVGLIKVTIKEVESNTPYRMAELKALKDRHGEADISLLQRKIFQRFEQLTEDDRFPLVSKYFRERLDFEMAVNLIAAHLPIDTEEKQKLLELDDLSLRARILMKFMESEFRDSGELNLDISGDLRMN